MNSDRCGSHCSIWAKDTTCDSYTYEDPVLFEQGVTDDAKVFPINVDTTIISTHLHGLEVRPAFDGNPLSWYANHSKNNPEKATVGVGYFSADSPYFRNSLSEKMRRRFDLADYSYKINVYPNTQQPGALWYHDHAMKFTKFNVAAGLAGSYIIRDPQNEEKDIISKSCKVNNTDNCI